MKSRFLSLLKRLLPSTATVFAQESGTCGAHLTWRLSNGTLTVSGAGEMRDYTYYTHVPWYSSRSSITTVIIGNNVTHIGDYAFYNCSSLTSVTIPESVTSIGDRAFAYCYSLASVTIPNSVASIGELAFSYCSSLSSVTVPDSVTGIGSNAFYSCSSLVNIDVHENNTKYASAGGVLFNNGKTTLIKYPEGKTAAGYTIPSSVTDIKSNAFSYCRRLASVTIPESVTSIGEGAFYYCHSLTSVTNLNPEPQAISSTVFGNVTLSEATLYVSAESVKDYEAAPVWAGFGTITA
ncbi:MAG: leucine-rich repeat domain-containing protein [Dysgonamonadaceae bacterium]|jgi:hypothetical protein|nr:leucine-rich repeat domain-containing protein [Dysgonamonadaceae bacterium]